LNLRHGRPERKAGHARDYCVRHPRESGRAMSTQMGFAQAARSGIGYTRRTNDRCPPESRRLEQGVVDQAGQLRPCRGVTHELLYGLVRHDARILNSPRARGPRDSTSSATRHGRVQNDQPIAVLAEPTRASSLAQTRRTAPATRPAEPRRRLRGTRADTVAARGNHQLDQVAPGTDDDGLKLRARAVDDRQVSASAKLPGGRPDSGSIRGRRRCRRRSHRPA